MDHLRKHPLYQKHNIDSAMNSLWDFYKKNFKVLFITSFVMSLVLQYISSLMNLSELQGINDPSELLKKINDFILPIMILSVTNLLFTAILQYYVIYNPVEQDKNIFRSAMNTMRFFIPYMIIIVLLGFTGSLAVIAGIFLFIVGAFFAFIYVLTIYLFILPVMMIEGPNIGNTISRVIRLTHRRFWSNIGWVGAFLILLIVITVLLSGITLIPFSGSFAKALFNPDEAKSLVSFTNNPVFLILTALANALTFPLVPIFASILYFNGKASEEVPVEAAEKSDEVKVRVEDLYAKPYRESDIEDQDKVI